jgi:DNA polymerase-1
VDYKQLEIVIMAILCGDEALLKDLRNGVDFHARRVPFFKPGLTYDYVMERLKAKDPEMKEMRRKAKTVSFQRLYGGGVNSIVRTTKLPKEVVTRLVEEENQMYPGIKRYHELVRAVGLRPGNPGLPACYHFELPTGCRMSFQHMDITKNLPPVKNYPIQGYGAEVVQMMLGVLLRKFVSTDFLGGKACIVNFVHDSIWMDVHEDVVEEAVRLCATTLADADRYICETFPGVEVGMPLGVTAEYGRSMATLEDCPPEWILPKAK